jgi:hypothetical protein
MKAAVTATSLLAVLLLTSCGKSQSTGGSSVGSGAPIGGSPLAGDIVQQTFDERVTSIDAAIPLATKVDTLLGTAKSGVRIIGWFSGQAPIRIDVEETNDGARAGLYRYYYENGGLVATFLDFWEERSGQRRHMVSRAVYGTDRRMHGLEMTVDGQIVHPPPAEWPALASMQTMLEADHRETLTRIARREGKIPL